MAKAKVVEQAETKGAAPSEERTYEKLIYEFILVADSPIAHHSESFGNNAIAMRVKTRMPDGSFVNIPILTGDTIRHGLREASAYAMLDAAGMIDDPGLGESALRLLFNGGMIDGGQDNAVKLDQYRELVELCPQIALLGGCAQNRSVPGRTTVDAAELICEETAHRMPGWVIEYLREQKSALAPARQHIEEVQRVRMDASLDPGKTKLLSDGGVGVRNRLLASEHGKEVGDAVLAQNAKSSMMPRRFETLVTGSIFYWRLEAEVFTALERDTFNTMVGMWLASARVGGKKATGHGRIRVVTARAVNWRRPREMVTGFEVEVLAPKVGSLFQTHLAARKDRVRKLLQEIQA